LPLFVSFINNIPDSIFNFIHVFETLCGELIAERFGKLRACHKLKTAASHDLPVFSAKIKQNAHLALISIPIFSEEAGIHEIFAATFGLICNCRLNESVDAFRRLRWILLFYEFSQAARRKLVDEKRLTSIKLFSKHEQHRIM
jgi:hypothetical protein